MVIFVYFFGCVKFLEQSHDEKIEQKKSPREGEGRVVSMTKWGKIMLPMGIQFFWWSSKLM
jgi:hypothetical protein